MSAPERPVDVRERRRRTIMRRRATALGAVAAVLLIIALALAAGGSPKPPRDAGARPAAAAPAPPPATAPSAPATTSTLSASTTATAPRRYRVGELVLHLVDGTRRVDLADGRAVPRRLDTVVRYPAQGAADGADHPGAAAARGDGPFPLVVFGHGFAVTPATYARLLRAWASAGYVVAAPVFPRTSSGASGGPDERDLPNQPLDMSFVISSMLAANSASSGPLRELVAPHQIAVAGQSDGGDTALAVAYDPRFHDPRVRAAMILSGAEIPFVRGFRIALGAPVLLAVQGTADHVNPPGQTRAFFDPAPPPKFLLELLGGSHLAPYSSAGPRLRTVERVTTAFLDRNLKHLPGALARMFAAGDVANRSTLLAIR